MSKAETVAQDLKESGCSQVSLVKMDLASLSSVRAASAEIEKACPAGIDVLINNAAIWPRQKEVTEDGFEKTFQVNHLSVFLLTHLLLPLINPKGRVVTVSSALHAWAAFDVDDMQFEKTQFNGDLAYRKSKLLNVLFANELDRRLTSHMADKGIHATSLHPGIINTALHREDIAAQPYFKYFHAFLTTFFGKSSATAGSQTTLYAALSPELDATGGVYLADCAAKQPNSLATQVNSKLLWHRSAQLLNLQDQTI